MTPASAAVTTTATTATASTALGLRPRFVHNQIASPEILTVHGIDRAIRFFVISDFDEGKTARLSCETVTNQINCRGIDTSLRKKLVQAVFRRGKRKITNVELLHLRTPSARNPLASRGAR